MIYLDASSIIYLIEGDSDLRHRVSTQLSAGESLCTSRLSWLECRVKPLRDKNASLLTIYERLFSSANLMLADIDARVVERATQIRASHGFKTPDAIHLSTAIETNATRFVTGDRRLARFDELTVTLV